MALHHEQNLEAEICAHLSSHDWAYSPNDDGYDKQRALFPEDLFGWLENTQPATLEAVARTDRERIRLLDRLAESLDRPLSAAGGTLSALRHGFKHIKQMDLCQFKPADAMNPTTLERYGKVRLRVMRQVRYSVSKTDSIDLVFFVNGLPVATAELKSEFVQDVHAAVSQYKRDRLPIDPETGTREPLLSFGHRALVHFAVDNSAVFTTTKLDGDRSRFLPFNRGNGHHAGNPPNAAGTATAYLWEEILQRDTWLKILGKFMHVQTSRKRDAITGRITRSATILFPRYHQHDVVTKLLADAKAKGPGQRYLIQHSAGSGKTNSIAWLAHQVSTLHDEQSEKVFDSVIVITDRTVLDDQLQDAIYQIDHKRGVVLPIGQGTDSDFTRRFSSKSEALTEALTAGGAIIVVTIQTVPFALEAIRTSRALKGKRFAVIVDEAHSSQTGDSANKLRQTLSGAVRPESEGEVDVDDLVRMELEGRGTLANVSFFAFTATPKGKTIQLFGTSSTGQETDKRPFHLYSMQQAIEEGFILDVLRNYTTYRTAFRLVHGGQDYDSQKVEKSKAMKSLMSWVRLHPYNIGQKVAIIVEHFRTNVTPLINGHAKAMIVADSRKSAVRYKLAVDKYLHDRRISGVAALVAFSGEVSDRESGPLAFTESSMNPKLRGRTIPEALESSDFQVLIVANKYQTGFDQPQLCAMYVDKRLDGVQAVQTLSRLNRTCPGKVTYVLDFANHAEDVLAAFKTYYEGAELTEASDPNLVFDQWDKLDGAGFFSEMDVEAAARAYFGHGTSKPTQGKLSAALSPVRDRFNAAYRTAIAVDDSSEIDRLDTFRRDLSTFVSTYDFLSSIVDYDDVDLEKRALFARMLAQVLKDSQRYAPAIDLSDVTLTHHALHKQPESNLNLSRGDAAGLSALVAAGSRSPHEGNLVPWSAILQQINALFQGDGLTDSDQITAVESVVRKMLDNGDLRAQARANNRQDFFAGPDLWSTLQEIIVEAGDQHAKGIERLAAERSRDDILAILAMMRLWETLRDA
ncbi:type I restriction enzyme R subunit [Micromonospora sp. A202]|uniref:type I restriction endonuclease subunit R n=1 Tax=Micromonospora sp. A202 TaxID=2572899 RepID=UPI00114EB550|nr:type I restriction endonuclease [Micromonospora sp. A202]TQJ23805.1 type I restriction enzyme R subunit [Micromonospora sp. A202]